MTGHKEFLENEIKAKKGILSEGIAEKDTWAGFGIEFMGRIGTQPGKT